MKNNFKRILALITVVLIICAIIATLVVAFLDFPNKETVFFSCMMGIIFLPIMAWIIMWMYGVITRNKNIASFRSKEMEETMQKADIIKYEQELAKSKQKDEI